MDTRFNPFSEPDDLFPLQWSHDLSVMDTGEFGLRRSLEGYALQWSHDLSVMDTLKGFR